MNSGESGGVTPGTANASSIAITRNTGLNSACVTISFPTATALTLATDLLMKLRRLSLPGCCSLMVVLSLNVYELPIRSTMVDRLISPQKSQKDKKHKRRFHFVFFVILRFLC